MSRNSEKALTVEEQLAVIIQFHQLNPQGIVSLAGGEPMMDSSQFFALTSLCRELSMHCTSNVNATYIDSQEIAERLLVDGPASLIVSLDSHVGEIHDFLRGVRGCYDQVLRAIKLLLTVRREKHPGINTKIMTNSIIFDQNLHLWKNYIDFAKELEIDGVAFQMLGRTIWNQAHDDLFFENHFFKDKDAAKDRVDEIIQVFGNDPFLLTNVQDLEWMKLYIDDPDFIGAQVCGSHERNIVIALEGDVQLCFNMYRLLNGRLLGNVRTQSLSDLWQSDLANEARQVMSRCRLNCGMLSCHRKLTSQSPSVPK